MTESTEPPTDTPFELEQFPVHLGDDSSAVVLDRHTGDMAWYMAYGQRFAHEREPGRLVSMHTFSESWTTWEVHPHGDELVLCTAGSVTLIQDDGTDVRSVVLQAGEAAVNAPGVWHTADVDGPCTCVFITAGAGTDHRPR